MDPKQQKKEILDNQNSTLKFLKKNDLSDNEYTHLSSSEVNYQTIFDNKTAITDSKRKSSSENSATDLYVGMKKSKNFCSFLKGYWYFIPSLISLIIGIILLAVENGNNHMNIAGFVLLVIGIVLLLLSFGYLLNTSMGNENQEMEHSSESYQGSSLP